MSTFSLAPMILTCTFGEWAMPIVSVTHKKFIRHSLTIYRNWILFAGEKTNQWIDSHHMVLYGHRSIVNQVRYNSQKCLIASSGVEKIIKLWRPFELEGWTGGLAEEPNGPTNARDIFSHEEYMSLFNVSGQNMSHDYSDQNTTEDPRMMAFFDSLVQREIEGWNSDDDNSSDSDKSSCHSSDGSSRPTSTLQSESDSTTSFQIHGRGKIALYFHYR